MADVANCTRCSVANPSDANLTFIIGPANTVYVG